MVYNFHREGQAHGLGNLCTAITHALAMQLISARILIKGRGETSGKKKSQKNCFSDWSRNLALNAFFF